MKKKIVIIIPVVLLVSVIIALVIYFNTRITDITRDGEVVEFNVNRTFYLDDNGKKKVEVKFEGIGNVATKNFEGEILVEGFEIEAEAIGYDFQILGEEFEKQEGNYVLTCIGVEYKNENYRYSYDINISNNFREIEIIITNWASGETFRVVNEGAK